MALDANTLSTALRAAMLANPAIGAIDGVALTALCDAISTTVVSHLTSSGVILPGTFTAPSGGGPVVGTGVIT